MKTQVVFVFGYSTRLKQHRVNPEFIGDRLGKEAKETNDWLFKVVTGLNYAELPASGRQPSIMECALVVANPLGLSVVFVSTMWGGSESLPTAANTCVPDSGDIWDERCGDERKGRATERLKKLHGEFWNGMQTLGAMAD